MTMRLMIDRVYVYITLVYCVVYGQGALVVWCGIHVANVYVYDVVYTMNRTNYTYNYMLVLVVLL